MLKKNTHTRLGLIGSFAASVLFLALVACSGSSQTPIAADDEALTFSQDGSDMAGFGFGRGPGMHAGGAMMAVLGLSDEQKTAIEAIVEEHRAQMPRGEGRRSGKSFEEMQEVRKAHHDEVFAKIQEVLTPEQRAKAETLKAQLEKGEVPQELVDFHVARMTEELNLTEEQQAQVRELKLAPPMFGRMHAEGDRGELRKQRREQMQERHDKLMEILTPEQQEILEAKFAERRKRSRRTWPSFWREAHARPYRPPH